MLTTRALGVKAGIRQALPALPTHWSPPNPPVFLLMRSLLPLPLLLAFGLTAHATVSSITVTTNGVVSSLQPGYTLVEALNFQGATVSRSGINFVGENMTDGAGGSATVATLGSGGVLSTADIGAGIDALFYTEVWNQGGTGIRLTISGLNPVQTYYFETYHGEPRNLPGTFSTVSFIDANGTVMVPTFTFGNTTPNENPPAAVDRVTIGATITGVTSFTYNMPNGSGRGSSLTGYQLSAIPEPGTAGLGLGALALMATRRRRN